MKEAERAEVLKGGQPMTSSKGYNFEERVFRWLGKALKSEEFPLHGPRVTLHRRPRYYSRDRDSEITFDISIEARRSPAVEPFLIWIWECKDYYRAVEVGDVEEFHAKIQQVGSDRTKGSMAITSSIQEGASRYAASHGIGIVRLMPDEEVLYMIEAMPAFGLRLRNLFPFLDSTLVTTRNLLRHEANRREIEMHVKQRWSTLKDQKL